MNWRPFYGRGSGCWFYANKLSVHICNGFSGGDFTKCDDPICTNVPATQHDSCMFGDDQALAHSTKQLQCAYLISDLNVYRWPSYSIISDFTHLISFHSSIVCASFMFASIGFCFGFIPVYGSSICD